MSVKLKIQSNTRRIVGPRSALCLSLVAAVQLSAIGCRATPSGRCGLPDQCAPAVVRDPFPYDVGVPNKGVDPETAGYYRPKWRVLNGQDAECCTEQCLPSSQPMNFIETGMAPAELPLPNKLTGATSVKSIPVSMVTAVAPVAPVAPPPSANSLPTLPAERPFRAFSSDVAPIVLPAPLVAPDEVKKPSQAAPLIPSELAPVLTR